ncbi:ERF family protein [Mammaliicoccus sciuri]|uniref:ERF family protein n=1 Tax=Mammaliicoccus sciuri TaxID=1296 RepID=UPI001E3B93F3|nr:ERF family protein [Mammaliicoccus sciuri]MCD8798655.1 ERF family protein [Mammaliicoccus sciuri]
MSETKLNLFQKIADVKSNIDGFTKDTKGYNYSYVSGSQVLHSIRNKMEEHNLLFVPHIKNASYQEIEVMVKGQKKPNILVSLDLIYTWIDADNPTDRFEIPFYAIGHQDDASKALGTALTYSERYLLMKQFNIPTDEDDADAKQKRETYAPKAKPEQIGHLKTKVKEALQVGKEGATERDIMDWLKISEYENLTEAQINPMIKALNEQIEAKRGGK